MILDLVMNQGQEIPFDPRAAINRFVNILKEYRISTVTGDRYAGETFRCDFEERGIRYETSESGRRRHRPCLYAHGPRQHLVSWDNYAMAGKYSRSG